MAEKPKIRDYHPESSLSSDFRVLNAMFRASIAGRYLFRVTCTCIGMYVCVHVYVCEYVCECGAFGRCSSQQERLESFYKNQADLYDSYRHRMLHGRLPMIEAMPAPQGAVWVDLGGGTGSNLEYFGTYTIAHVASRNRKSYDASQVTS
jgi:hypothetical protein